MERGGSPLSIEGPRSKHQALLGDDSDGKNKGPGGPSNLLRWAGIVLLGGIYMCISSGLIVLNKYLMSVDGFHYPLFLSSLGMAFSGVASFLACRVFRLVEAKRSVSLRFYCTRILPVGLLMSLTLFCGNLVYLYLTVSFIQMLKAFCPVITMAALFIAGLEAPSRRLISSVLAIALGTAIASYGELNLSYMGVLIMFLSEAFESTRLLVMTQMLLVGLRFHPIEGLMYLAPACVLWGALGVWLIEWPAISAENGLALIAAKPLLYTSAAAMGFAVNLLAYIVIQLASSLTLKVLGTVKNTLVVCAGVLLYRDSVTPLQGAGYSVSLAGFVLYNHIKMAGGGPPLPPAAAKDARDGDIGVLEAGLGEPAKRKR